MVGHLESFYSHLYSFILYYLFQSVDDEQVSVGVVVTEISCPEPSVRVEGVSVCFWILYIAFCHLNKYQSVKTYRLIRCRYTINCKKLETL